MYEGFSVLRSVQELENYVMQLRQQMDEGASERGTLIGVQRQLRNDLAKLADEASEAHTEAANARHELNVCQTQLRVRPRCPPTDSRHCNSAVLGI